MKNYMLIIMDSPATAEVWAQLTPEQMQEGLAAYMAFSQKLQAEGRMVAGEGLGQEGKILRPTESGVEVTDGPLVLAKEMVGGFYLFKASSLEEAVEIAKECPALRHGATVEVRAQMDY